MTIYTISELVEIQATAQMIANQACQMSTMLIYANNDMQGAVQVAQNGLQRSFSALHGTMLGCDFEVAQIDAQEAVKLTPRDFAAFVSVAGVIGVDEAETQLQAVINGWHVDKGVAGAATLNEAFTWADTAQGHNYWSKINKAIKQQEAK